MYVCVCVCVYSDICNNQQNHFSSFFRVDGIIVNIITSIQGKSLFLNVIILQCAWTCACVCPYLQHPGDDIIGLLSKSDDVITAEWLNAGG